MQEHRDDAEAYALAERMEPARDVDQVGMNMGELYDDNGGRDSMC